MTRRVIVDPQACFQQTINCPPCIKQVCLPPPPSHTLRDSESKFWVGRQGKWIFSVKQTVILYQFIFPRHLILGIYKDIENNIIIRTHSLSTPPLGQGCFMLSFQTVTDDLHAEREASVSRIVRDVCVSLVKVVQFMCGSENGGVRGGFRPPPWISEHICNKEKTRICSDKVTKMSVLNCSLNRMAFYDGKFQFYILVAK